MASQVDNPKYNPRVLDRALFESAKKWWLFALICRLIVFIVSVVVILAGVIPEIAPFITIILLIAAELILWESNRKKDVAETLLRKLDVHDSFGWSISGSEMSDMLIHIPSGVKERASAQEAIEKYFASAEDPGPTRAIENLQESAWWSKHLAARSGFICLLAMCVTVVVSLILIIVSVETISNFDVLSSIGRVVTSTIALIFSLGLFRLTTDYYSFSKRAAQVEKEAEHLLGYTYIDSVQAIQLTHEYQLARAAAPLIATRVYNSMRSELDNLWMKYRQRSQ
jgi:hypothetical protein